MNYQQQTMLPPSPRKKIAYKAPNCSADSEPTTLFTYFAHVDGSEDLDYHSFMLSCQDVNNSGKPDASTYAHMKSIALENISKDSTSKIYSSCMKES